jgi:hypothetical protein
MRLIPVMENFVASARVPAQTGPSVIQKTGLNRPDPFSQDSVNPVNPSSGNHSAT